MRVPTLTAVAHPWHCDVMGHMNTRHIMGLFDDACFSLLDRLGCDFAQQPPATHGWADVKLDVSLEREIPAGTVLQVTSGIRRLGRTSFVHVHELASKGGAVRHATLEATSVRFDLAARKSAPLTDEFRRVAGAMLAEGDTPAS